MGRQELYDSWLNNNDRPAWIRANREALMDHIDTADPIPRDSLAAIDQWTSRYKSTVTRQLQPDCDATEVDA